MLLGNIPSDNLESTLDNYDPSRKTYPEDGVYAQNLARALVELETGKPAGLLLTGESGNGKTHLAVGIGRTLAERGDKVVFTKFEGNNWDLRSIPGGLPGVGWLSDIEGFVEAHDTFIFDDLPGDMAPGWRKALQEITLASYNQGKRVVMTSNQLAPMIIEQLGRPGTGELGALDAGPALKERIRQTWNLVEFRGESFRSGQDKWYAGVERPADAPTIDQAVRAAAELDKQQRDNTILRALAAALLPVAIKAGVAQPQLQDLKAALGRPKGS